MNTEWLAIVMFAIFMALIVIGYPVAFSFALTAIAFTMLGLWLGDIRVQQLNAFPSRWFGYISDQNLLAIPFFVYMGAIFEKSGQAERLLTAVGRLMGPLRGGLALTVVVVGTMLAAATGVVAATVIMMGLLSLPAMVRYGYDHRLATGVIAASGTLAQLIPPSLVLIVLASTTRGVSVGGAVPRRHRPRADAVRPLRACTSCTSPFAIPDKAPALPTRGAPGMYRGWALARESVDRHRAADAA